MGFSSFLNEYEKMLQEIEVVMEAADTIDWNPTQGAEYAGTGINRTLPEIDPARTQRTRTLPPLTTEQKPKQGDVVFLKAPGGGFVPAAVLGLDRSGGVQVSNKGRNISGVRPLGEFRPAPAAIMKNFPGRTGWLIVSGAASTLV